TYNWPLPLKQTKADERGEFAYETSRSGRHVVWANHGTLTSRHKLIRGKPVLVSADGMPPEAAELRLSPGRTARVTVVSKADGQPVAGAIVRYVWSEMGDFHTDRNGQAKVEPLPWEKLQFEVVADGYAKQMHWLDLQSANGAMLAVSLEPGGAVEGTVHDADGKPLPGTEVGASVVGKLGLFWTPTTADSAGRYRIANLPLNESIQLSVAKDGYLRDQHKVFVSEPTIHFDFTMAPRPHGGSVKGIVIDREGRPVRHARLFNQGSDHRDERITASDDGGNFLLDDLFRNFAGCQIAISAKGFAPAMVDVKPGPANAPAELKVVLEPGHKIAGKVVDEDGKPLAGVWVGWNQNRRGLHDSTYTDDAGHFELDSLPDDCVFAFNKQDYSPLNGQQLPLDGEGLVNVILSPQGVIRGKVVDARTGETLHGFRVRLNLPRRRSPNDPRGGIPSELVEPGQAFQASDGSFEIKGLSLRLPVQVMVDADGYEPCINERIECRAPSEATPVEFRMIREDPANLVAYRGRLLDAQDKPIAGAQLRLIAAVAADVNDRTPSLITWSMIQNGRVSLQSRVRRFVQAATGKDGTFHFKGIRRDLETELAWWGEGITPGRRKELQKLNDVERTEMQITLDPPARIVGRIDRQLFPEATRVMVHSGGVIDFIDVQLTTRQEKFEVPNLPAGKYLVRLMGPRETAPTTAAGFGFRIGTPLQPIETIEAELKAGQEAEAEFNARDKKKDGLQKQE
ncbi:MAG: carboxypeptidase regulatory-like domain-containing protein, partial [Pirellulales bacterium]